MCVCVCVCVCVYEFVLLFFVRKGPGGGGGICFLFCCLMFCCFLLYFQQMAIFKGITPRNYFVHLSVCMTYILSYICI